MNISRRLSRTYSRVSSRATENEAPNGIGEGCAKSPMHQCPFWVSEHPPARACPTTGTGVSQHAGVCSGPATKKVEAIFAELKNRIGLRRLRLRRLKFVREQFFLAAAQNLNRLKDCFS